MKPCNVEEMIERAVTNGIPVTVSDMFSVTDHVLETPVTEVKPINSTLPQPQSISHSAHSDTLYTFGQAYAPEKSDRHATNSWKVPVAQLTVSPEVKQILRRLDSNSLPSDLLSPKKTGIYKDLVEDKFSNLSEHECSQLFKKLGGGYDRIIRNRDGQIYWNGVKYNSVISFALAILDREPLVAAIVVGELLGVKPELCFRTYPVRGECSSVFTMPYTTVQEYIPKRLTIEQQIYPLQDIEYLKDSRGSREQAVCHYVDIANPLDDFFLIAGRVEINGTFALKIGATAVPARLYSRVMIAQHGSATVLLIHDMRTAKEFRAIARESCLRDHTNIIVSGCYGGASALAALNFKDIAGHPVVIHPEPTAEGLTGVIDWAKRLTQAGATSVSVYPQPITVSACLPSMTTINASWERDLWEQAVCLEDIERPSKFARDLCANSIPISDYPKWLNTIGLVADAVEDAVLDLESEDGINFTRLGDIPDGGDDDGPITLESFFNRDNTSAIWGPTDVAKTWFIDELAVGFSTGTPAFGIPALRPHVVCIMDGEISIRNKRMRCKQLLQNRPQVTELADKNLLILPPIVNFKRFDSKYADMIIPKLQKIKAELLIIDNLQALDSNAGKYSSVNLNQFILKLKLNGIAVLIVHHSDKEGINYKGPTDFVDLAQNVFRLEGRKQLRILLQDNIKVKDACEEGGPVIRVTVEKSKICGLNDRSIIYHLPKYGTWRWLEGSLIPASITLPGDESGESEMGDITEPIGHPSEMDELSPDEEKVCKALFGKKYTRAELEKLTGLKSDKLGGILRKLVKQGRVKQVGTGKATYYQGV
jgi:hypothetical protein